jgi:hypothetical protein
MKHLVFISVLFGFAVPAEAQVAKAAKELVEWLFKTEARKNLPKNLLPRVENLMTKHGISALQAIKKAGPSAITILERDGSRVMLDALKLGGRNFANEALTSPALIRKVLKKCGPEAAEVIAKHPGAGARFLFRVGPKGIPVAKSLSRKALEDMVGLSDDIYKSGYAPGFWKVLGKYGDRASDFIWRNKGAIFVAAVAASFIRDPEAYLSGARKIGQSVAEGVGRGLSGSVGSFPWGIAVPGLVLVLAMACYLKFFWRRRRVPGLN